MGDIGREQHPRILNEVSPLCAWHPMRIANLNGRIPEELYHHCHSVLLIARVRLAVLGVSTFCLVVAGNQPMQDSTMMYMANVNPSTFAFHDGISAASRC